MSEPLPSTMSEATDSTLLRRVTVGATEITLLGTAHVSRASAEQVKALVESGEYDAVAVELCPSRLDSLLYPEKLAEMDLFQVIKSGKAGMVAASLALGAYQQRLAEQFGIEPGAEMRAASDAAEAAGLPLLLIDREIGATLKRIHRRLGWWQRWVLMSGLGASLFSREKVSEDEIERLKEGDILESTFSEFAERNSALYETLIQERDRFMAARLREEAADKAPRKLLAVVGAGHLAGIERYLNEAATQAPDPAVEQAELNHVPEGSRWPKLIPWLILLLVTAGFVWAFVDSPELGLQVVVDWILITGGLCALGTLLAGAHPLSVIGAFVAAPFTTLHPALGAGFVVAGIELTLRKPKVSDFASLRHDVTHWRGWWRNRVARTLLVFIFSTLGAASGTYVAGFRLFGRLAG